MDTTLSASMTYRFDWTQLPIDLYYLIASELDITSFVRFVTCNAKIKNHIRISFHEWCLKKQQELNKIRAYHFVNKNDELLELIYFDKNQQSEFITISDDEQNQSRNGIDVFKAMIASKKVKPIVMKTYYCTSNSSNFVYVDLLWDIEFNCSGGIFEIDYRGINIFTLKIIEKGVKYRFSPPNTGFPIIQGCYLNFLTTNLGEYYFRGITLKHTLRNAILYLEEKSLIYPNNTVHIGPSIVVDDRNELIQLKHYSSYLDDS